MPKNIDNRTKDTSGLVVKSSDSVPEGVTNLYYTSSRVNTLIANNPNYKNAEFLFAAPISGPAIFPGTMLNFDGTMWQTTQTLRIHNGNDIRTSGDYLFPAATNGTIGPNSLTKLAGNQTFARIQIPNNAMSGYIELFITGRDTITGTMYQNNNAFFYENALGIITITTLSGFYSAAFTQSVSGTTVLLLLNTVNNALVTATVKYQTVTGVGVTVEFI